MVKSAKICSYSHNLIRARNREFSLQFDRRLWICDNCQVLQMHAVLMIPDSWSLQVGTPLHLN